MATPSRRYGFRTPVMFCSSEPGSRGRVVTMLTPTYSPAATATKQPARQSRFRSSQAANGAYGGAIEGS